MSEEISQEKQAKDEAERLSQKYRQEKEAALRQSEEMQRTIARLERELKLEKMFSEKGSHYMKRTVSYDNLTMPNVDDKVDAPAEEKSTILSRRPTL